MTARIARRATRSRKSGWPELTNNRPADSANGTAARTPTPEEVRVVAYHKWESAGCPPGDGICFWLEAERELVHGGLTRGAQLLQEKSNELEC